MLNRLIGWLIMLLAAAAIWTAIVVTIADYVFGKNWSPVAVFGCALALGITVVLLTFRISGRVFASGLLPPL